MTAQRRAQLLAEKGPSALYHLWAANEEGCDGPDVQLDGPQPITDLFAQVYDLLCQSEEQHMPPFRALLQRVALALNQQDWSGVCPVTDDFVVVPADGSRFFCDEYCDIAGSVPAQRLELLRSRGLLGPGKHWEGDPTPPAGSEVEAHKRAVLEMEAKARSLPLAERIAFWIDELDKLARRQPCQSSQLGLNAHFPIGNVVEVGPAAIVPLLQLACKWAQTPVWVWPSGVVPDEDNAEYGPLKEEVLLYILWKVKELGVANREVELLLREFLEKSCRASEGKPLWSTLPVHCADCLHTLFGRYPKSEMGGSNELENRDQFLQVPIPPP